MVIIQDFSNLTSRQFKLLLQPQRLKKLEDFHKLSEVINLNLSFCDLHFQHNPYLEPFIRVVWFYDTKNFDLFNNSFILRKRRFYRYGLPRKTWELVVKFRHSSKELAAQVAMTTTIDTLCKNRFKEEILMAGSEVGSLRSIYSNNCKFISPRINLSGKLSKVFKYLPGVQPLLNCSERKLRLVNSLPIKEVLVKVGEIRFSETVKTEITMALWRNLVDETPLVGELSFEYKVNHPSSPTLEQMQQSEKFFRLLQVALHDKLFLGSTKTALIYNSAKKKTE
ncbi:MAG: hypothetical protein DSM106950_02320 [Stigonema ocellatum SAG 48.90 = DSM 106950]|nr:hypothetical protein [Stigonema ocellatum SAG 48.90 = DSM 106950]